MKNIKILQNNGVDIESAVNLLGGIEYYDKTLNEFLNEINQLLIKIKNCKEQNDMINYSILVQGLKSDSEYLGFTRLAKLSHNHEIASKQNDIKYIYEHYNELMMEAVRIFNLIKSYMGLLSKKDTIIIADDSSIICNFVKKIFSDEFEILTANDGNEVINIVEKNKDRNIACVLLDLNMPNLDGFAVLEYFNENDLFSKVPVSIISGDDTKDSIDKVFNYPIVDMLNKPFNVNEIKRIVERTMTI